MAERLDKLVVDVARLTVRALVEKTLSGDVRPVSLEHAFNVLWTDAMLQQIRQMAASMELDLRPLVDEPRFRQLALLAFQEEFALLSVGARRARERIATEDLAAAVARERCPGVVRIAPDQLEWLLAGAPAGLADGLRDELTAAVGQGAATDAGERETWAAHRLASELRARIDATAEPATLVSWSTFGRVREGDTQLPDPAFETDRVLAYDEDRRAIVYLQRRGDTTIGPLWQRDGERWHALPDSTVEMPTAPYKMISAPHTRLSLVTDPARGGLVAWTIVATDVFSCTPIAFRFDGGARRIAVPEVTLKGVQRDDLAAFVHDARRGVTVLVLAKEIWELDAAGTWRRAAEGLDDLASLVRGQDRDLHPELQAVHDPVHGVVVAVIARGHMTTLSWDGQVRRQLDQRPMRDGGGGFGIAMWSQPDGVRAYVAGEVCSLGEAGWQPPARCAPSVAPHRISYLDEIGLPTPVASAPARDPQQPVRDFLGVGAAYDPGDDALVLGPGRWNRGAHQHAFHIEHDGTWTRRALVTETPPRPGPLVPCDGELVWCDGRTLMRFEPLTSRWVAHAELPLRPHRLVAGLADDLYAIERNGVAVHGRPGAWSAPSLDASGTASRLGRDVLAAVDPASTQLVLWDPADRQRGDAAWRGRRGAVLLVADTGIGRLVRFAPGEVALWDGERWMTRLPDVVLAAVHPTARLAVHDRQSGETLVVDLMERWIVRFDLAHSAIVGRAEWPRGLLASGRGSGDAGFPFKATGYEPVTRTLRTHSAQDPFGNYILELGPLFDAAARLGPRTRPPDQLSSAVQEPFS